MPTYPFKQVDVFSSEPLRGNPVAVVLDADAIAPETMQRIATWTNLSETTFVLRPTHARASYRLRIFTPGGELPFAGHPTLGSLHAVLERGTIAAHDGRLVQECAAGLLPLTIIGDGSARRLTVQVPEPKVARGCADLADALADALGAPLDPRVAPAAIDVGPVWLVALLPSHAATHAIAPDMAALDRLSRAHRLTGVTVFSLGERDEPSVYVRSFAPAMGAPEDPVCGSGNASVGAFLAYTGLLARTGDAYTARQGHEMGRDGWVAVDVRDDGRTVTIGGRAVTTVDGVLRL